MALDISEMLTPKWAEKWAERFREHADKLAKETDPQNDGTVTDIRQGQAAKFRRAANKFHGIANRLREK